MLRYQFPVFMADSTEVIPPGNCFCFYFCCQKEPKKAIPVFHSINRALQKGSCSKKKKWRLKIISDVKKKNKAGSIREGFIKSTVSEVLLLWLIIVLPVQNRCLLEPLFHLKKFSWKKPQALCTEQRPMALLCLKPCVHCYNHIQKCLSCLKG